MVRYVALITLISGFCFVGLFAFASLRLDDWSVGRICFCFVYGFFYVTLFVDACWVFVWVAGLFAVVVW